jgi:hypothetical protein
MCSQKNRLSDYTTTTTTTTTTTPMPYNFFCTPKLMFGSPTQQILPHATTKMQGNLTNIKDNYQSMSGEDPG